MKCLQLQTVTAICVRPGMCDRSTDRVLFDCSSSGNITVMNCDITNNIDVSAIEILL